MEQVYLLEWEVKKKSLMGWVYQYLQGQANLFSESKE